MTEITHMTDILPDDILLIHMLERKFEEAVIYMVKDLSKRKDGVVVVSKKSNPSQGGSIDQYTLNVSYKLYRLNIEQDPEYFL